MKTPITDELWQARDGETFAYHTARIKDGMARLETDRAALMESLAEIHQEAEMGSFAENRAWDALSAARANFPTA